MAGLPGPIDTRAADRAARRPARAEIGSARKQQSPGFL